MEMKVSLETDADGFLSQECPACLKRFKAVFEEGSDKTIGHCPYCGHVGNDCWWTEEQIAYFQGVVTDEMVAPMLGDFARDINQMSRPGDLVQMKAEVSHDPSAAAPVEPDGDLQVATFACCGERIKHDGSADRLRCVICGQLNAGYMPYFYESRTSTSRAGSRCTRCPRRMYRGRPVITLPLRTILLQIMSPPGTLTRSKPWSRSSKKVTSPYQAATRSPRLSPTRSTLLGSDWMT